MRYWAVLAMVGLVALVGCDDPVESEEPSKPEEPSLAFEAEVLSETAPDSLFPMLRSPTAFLNDAGEAVWHEDAEAVFWAGSSLTSIPMTAKDLGPEGGILGMRNGVVVLWEGGNFTEVTTDGEPLGIADDNGQAYFKRFYTSYGDAHVWIFDPDDGSIDEFGGNSLFPVGFAVGPDGDTVHAIEGPAYLAEVTDQGNVLYTYDGGTPGHNYPCAVAYSDGTGQGLGGGEWYRYCHPIEGENGVYLYNVSAVVDDPAGTAEPYGIRGFGADLNAAGWGRGPGR